MLALCALSLAAQPIVSEAAGLKSVIADIDREVNGNLIGKTAKHAEVGHLSLDSDLQQALAKTAALQRGFEHDRQELQVVDRLAERAERKERVLQVSADGKIQHVSKALHSMPSSLAETTDPDLVSLHEVEKEMDKEAKAMKEEETRDTARHFQHFSDASLAKERKKLLAAHDLPKYSDIDPNSHFKHHSASLLQTKARAPLGSELDRQAQVFVGLNGGAADLLAASASMPPMSSIDLPDLNAPLYSGDPLSKPMPSHWSAHDELRSEEAQMAADISAMSRPHSGVDPAEELAANFEQPDGTVRPIGSWLQEKEHLRAH